MMVSAINPINLMRNYDVSFANFFFRGNCILPTYGLARFNSAYPWFAEADGWNAGVTVSFSIFFF